MTPRAHTGDQIINTIGEIRQDFLGSGAHMRVDVGRVFKLLRHPGTWRLCNQLFCPGNGAVHAFFALGQVKTGAVS